MKDIDIKLEMMKSDIDVIYLNSTLEGLSLTRRAVQHLLELFKKDLLEVYEIGKRDAQKTS